MDSDEEALSEGSQPEDNEEIEDGSGPESGEDEEEIEDGSGPEAGEEEEESGSDEELLQDNAMEENRVRDPQLAEQADELEDESDEEEDNESDSDVEFPEFEFEDDGGEMMRQYPAEQIQPMAVQEEPMEVDDFELQEFPEDENNNFRDVFAEFDENYLQKTLVSICSNLTFQEMKVLRAISPRFNIALVEKVETFYKRCKGKFKTTYYRNGPNVNSAIAIKLNEAIFQNFTFYRRHEFFKKHWQLTAVKLQTLELTDSSFECEGFKFLVDFAPNLRNLSIKNCKLRDLEDIHENPRKIPVTTVKVPQHLGITSLHLEALTVVEICFMSYLVEKIKPNTLTEISMSKCFVDDHIIDREGAKIFAGEYFRFFLPLVVNLIMKSSASLKKMTFEENQFQMMIFHKLAEDSEAARQLNPTHLSLALLRCVPEEENWNGVLGFFRNRCSKLEKLNLQIVGEEISENLRGIVDNLALSNCPLKSFIFKFGGKPQDTKVEIGGLLTSLQQLKQLIIGDTKVLDPDVKYIVGGERFYRYRLHGCFGNTPAYSERLISLSMTNIAPTFLAQLPPNLEQLCLNRFMPDGNMWLDALQNPICFQSFEKLTKLEIRGPYFHSVHLAIPKLLTLVNLETLALTNCDIQDTYITGLGYEAIMDMRRCLTHYITTSALTKVTAKELDKIIRASPNYVFKNQPVAAPRPHLGNLAKLKYLDLSHNPQLSDVAVYDSLRLPLVETLVLNSCFRVSDIGLELIRMNFPSLKILSVKYCRKMSEYGLNELVRGIPNLKRIHTTRTVINRKIRGFQYSKSPRYDDVVRTTIATESEGFILDDMDN